MVAPSSSEGFASGSSTLHTICSVEAPIDCAASTTPASTSLTELSTMRATKGKAAIKSGGTMAEAPMVVPISRRVKGMSSMRRMRKGAARKKLMMAPSTLLSFGMG